MRRRPAWLAALQVVAVRGSPKALATRLWPRHPAAGAEERLVVVLGDGTPWIGTGRPCFRAARKASIHITPMNT